MDRQVLRFSCFVICHNVSCQIWRTAELAEPGAHRGQHTSLIMTHHDDSCVCPWWESAKLMNSDMADWDLGSLEQGPDSISSVFWRGLRSLEGYHMLPLCHLALSGLCVCAGKVLPLLVFSLCDLTPQEQIKGDKFCRENPHMQPVGRAWPHQLNLFPNNVI